MASSSTARGDFVFGYGSLSEFGDGLAGWLRGHRRWWGVAMDNALHDPGYKRYAAADGTLPDVCVAFLDVLPEPGAPGVNGVLLPCDADRLAALDHRERNYSRVDVTALVDDPPGRVWTYVGLAASRRRLRDARTGGRAVVSRGYVQKVRDGFALRGGLEDYDATTLPHGLPVADLVRVPG